MLVNDWSARDIQRWEYVAARPVPRQVVRHLDLARGSSRWRRVAAPRHAPPQDPEPLEYLRTEGDWALDIELEVELNGTIVSRTNARGLYWTFPQQLAHATVNGAPHAAGRPLRLGHDLRQRSRAPWAA